MKQIAAIDRLVDVLHATIPIIVEQFKNAAVRGDSMAADKHREDLLRVQGEMMDHVYASIALRKAAGLI